MILIDGNRNEKNTGVEMVIEIVAQTNLGV
jgi:hypothetical protein